MPLDPFIAFGLTLALWAAFIAYTFRMVAIEKRRRLERRADRLAR